MRVFTAVTFITLSYAALFLLKRVEVVAAAGEEPTASARHRRPTRKPRPAPPNAITATPTVRPTLDRSMEHPSVAPRTAPSVGPVVAQQPSRETRPSRCAALYCRSTRNAMYLLSTTRCQVDCVAAVHFVTKWNQGWRCGTC